MFVTRINLDRDDQIVMNGLVLYAGGWIIPGASKLSIYRSDGIIITILLHAGPVEFVYYWLHRALHHHYLYSRYHSHHHSSIVTQPISCNNFNYLISIFNYYLETELVLNYLLYILVHGSCYSSLCRAPSLFSAVWSTCNCHSTEWNSFSSIDLRIYHVYWSHELRGPLQLWVHTASRLLHISSIQIHILYSLVSSDTHKHILEQKWKPIILSQLTIIASI